MEATANDWFLDLNPQAWFCILKLEKKQKRLKLVDCEAVFQSNSAYIVPSDHVKEII